MKDFDSIELCILADVHGGETSRSSVNIGATIPTPRGPAQLGVQGTDERTNYDICTGAVLRLDARNRANGQPGITPAELAQACPLPGSGQ